MRESTMILTFHNCKKPGCKMKDCKQLMKKSDKSSGVENVKIKWCSYHLCNGHSNKYCYQQYWESANRDRKKKWCTYHHSASHLNDECFHQRGSKFENSSSVDTGNYWKRKTFIADSVPTGCDARFCCKCKRENIFNESNYKSCSPPPGIGFSFAVCHPPLS